MLPRIEYNGEKNLLLKVTRGICFEDVVKAIKQNKILCDYQHHDCSKYPMQRILVVEIDKYAHVVPYLFDKERNMVFLKTVYPSRNFTKKYLKKDEKQETNYEQNKR